MAAWAIGMGIVLLRTSLIVVFGPFRLLYSLARWGWSGWGRSISVLLGPVEEGPLILIALPGLLLRFLFRRVWRLVGWESLAAPKSDRRESNQPQDIYR